ncbi:MAG: FxLYD domain-containing protein [Spirochaetes bacterium]|nr:FxLYD domain-containing protein [Spirochaetota bacterium]
MKSQLHCSSCGNTNIKKISRKEYQCLYCGATILVDGRQGKAKNKRAMPAVQIWVVFFLFLFFLPFAFVFIFVLPQSVQKEEKIEIPEINIDLGLDEFPSVTSDDEFMDQQAESAAVYQDKKAQPAPKGEFDQISIVTTSNETQYFFGIYKNVGKVPIDRPSVTLVFYSEDNKKVAVKNGFSIRSVLLPGEETPLSIYVKKLPPYSRYEVKVNPAVPFIEKKRPPLKTRNTQLVKDKYFGYVIKGEIENSGERPVQYINIMGVLLDEQGKIIGGNHSYASEDVIKGQDYTLFEIEILTVQGNPHSYLLDYSASYVNN